MRPYIKRIEIHNYKTHKNTKLTLSEGINSIVGPNGVGKSNIVEAIIFCLGERSPKYLRVSSFNELIYNFRKDLDLSVTLTLVDAQGNEHKFKRIYSPKKGHIYRYNGKIVSRTSYLINLLKLGGKGFKYVYIRQGDITRWAEASPREIRDIIHEALGIKQYNQKRKEALEKLREAETKLEGIQTNYREMQKIVYEFRDLLIAYDTLSNIQNIKSSIETELLRRKLKDLQVKRQKLINIDKKLSEKESKISNKLINLNTKLETLRNKNKEIMEKYENYEKKIRALNSEILAKLEEENKIRDRIRENKLTSIMMEINYLKEQVKEERRKAKEESNNIKTIIKLQRQYQRELRRIENEINVKNNKVIELNRAIDELETHKKEIIDSYAQNINKKLKELLETEVIKVRRKEIEEEIKDIQHRIRNYQKTIENLRKKREQNSVEIKSLKDKLETHRKRMRELSRKIERVNKEITNAYKLLNKLDRVIDNISREGIHESRFYKDATRVYEVTKKIRLDGVYGILSDLVKGPKAILSLLKDLDIRGWYSIIVKDHETAIKVLEIARDLNKEIHVKVANVKPNQDIDDNSVIYILKYPKKIENLIINLYGDINRVTSFEEAIEMINEGKRAVHVNGSFLLYRGGLLSSGKIFIKLPKDIETIVNVRNKFRETISKREKHLEQLKKEFENLKREETNYLSKIVTLKLTINFIDKNIKFISNIIKRLREKRREKEEVLKEYGKTELEDKDITQQIEMIDAKLRALTNDKNRLIEDLNLLHETKRNLETKISQIESQILLYRQLNQERLIRIATLKQKIKEKQDLIPQLRTQVKEDAQKLKEIRSYRVKLLNDLNKYNKKLDKLRNIQNKINAQISKILDYINKIRDKENLLTSKRSDVRSRLLIIKRSIEELQSKLDRFELKTMEISDIEYAKKLYENIVEEENTLPQTSEVIVKWYLERIEPYKIYSTRRTELLKEKESILNFIREIDAKREEIFFKGFKDIKERFYTMFKEIFPDGEVEIKLSKEEDIDSDVLIYVQFRGKPKILLSTASGGEKTSLILLLLFSIYSVNKDTVFILDEVDAHMDLRVVDNIANIIKAQRKYSQIILVTLPGHDSMINIADIVIPVTFSRQASRVFPIKREMLDKVRRE